MKNKEDDTIDQLILEGALVHSGKDSVTGENMYVFTSKIRHIMPELYDQHLTSVNKELMNLWEKGYLDMDLFAESPIVRTTDKAFDLTEVNKLSKREIRSLKEIKRILKGKAKEW